MMLAEKAADLILGATPLPPSAAPFYRHGKDPAPGSTAPAAAGGAESTAQQ
jgi:choline dehydrogenase